MNVTSRIAVGSSAVETVVVTRELTVANYHPDMPEIYGTPMMIYLMEVAAAAAMDRFLPDGWVSVGASVNVRHIAPTPVGLKVTATATVEAIDENIVHFKVEAVDEVETIGTGTHSRIPVQLDRILKRARSKAPVNGNAPV